MDIHPGPVQTVAAGRTADGRVLLATGGRADRTVRLWEVNDLLAHGQRTPPIVIERIAAAGGLVATAHPDPVVRIWVDGQVVRELVHEQPVTALFTVSDWTGTALLVCGCEKASPRVWNLTTGERLDHGLSQVTRRIVACAATPDEVLLITADETHIRAWNALDGQPRWHLPAPYGLAVTMPDGRLLICREDDDLSMHDPATGHRVGPPISGLWAGLLSRAGQVTPIGTRADTDPPIVAFHGDGLHAWSPELDLDLTGEDWWDHRDDPGFQYAPRDDTAAANAAALLRLSDGSALAAIGGPVLRLYRLTEADDPPTHEWPYLCKWTKLADVHLDTPVTALAVDNDALLVGTARGLACLQLDPAGRQGPGRRLPGGVARTRRRS